MLSGDTSLSSIEGVFVGTSSLFKGWQFISQFFIFTLARGKFHSFMFFRQRTAVTAAQDESDEAPTKDSVTSLSSLRRCVETITVTLEVTDMDKFAVLLRDVGLNLWDVQRLYIFWPLGLAVLASNYHRGIGY